VTQSFTVLVTGASGFAGSHLVEHLALEHDLVAWTRSAPPTVVASLGRWQTVDLLDRNRVRAAIADLRPSAIYHCAGMPHVAQSWHDTTLALEGNVLATEHLLDAVRRAGLSCRVLITGSAAIYAPSAEPITESHPIAPASPYALSKLAQEQLALRAVQEDGIDVVIARAFNHTGPRQTPAFVAPSIARQVAMIERGRLEPVIRVGNLDARRDLADVRDVIRAYVAIMRSGTRGTIYNVASGVARSIRSILDALVARARVPVRIETDPDRMRANDIPVLVGDFSRLAHATAWRPTVTFDQMLDDLLGYWRSQVEK
jgi:GDP-4-dehydro-6-deoxy-D-mannose reductase